MHRESILNEAARLITEDRKQSYGHPRINHDRIAKLWSVILEKEISIDQVAICMAMVKAARLVESPDHLDSYIDATAYFAIAGQLATEENA